MLIQYEVHISQLLCDDNDLNNSKCRIFNVFFETSLNYLQDDNIISAVQLLGTALSSLMDNKGRVLFCLTFGLVLIFIYVCVHTYYPRVLMLAEHNNKGRNYQNKNLDHQNNIYHKYLYIFVILVCILNTILRKNPSNIIALL